MSTRFPGEFLWRLADRRSLGKSYQEPPNPLFPLAPHTTPAIHYARAPLLERDLVTCAVPVPFFSPPPHAVPPHVPPFLHLRPTAGRPDETRTTPPLRTARYRASVRATRNPISSCRGENHVRLS